MVFVEIFGGLGNQMFQYAAAKALSCHHKTGLTIDNYRLTNAIYGENVTPRQFELDIFSECGKVPVIKYPFLSSFKLFPSLQPHAFDLVRKLLMSTRGTQLVKGKEILSASTFYDLPSSSYLVGYFASEIFFEKYRREILDAFRFPAPVDSRNIALMREMKERKSISIHVRRTDYLTTDNGGYFTICGLDYYSSAIQMMEEKTQNLHYYVFSDDIKWAVANLPLPIRRFTAIDYNTGLKSFEDMRLMSCCQHNITANSTFSWWGAWLNTNQEKIVIIPKRWYQKPQGSIEEIIIPKDWIAL